MIDGFIILMQVLLIVLISWAIISSRHHRKAHQELSRLIRNVLGAAKEKLP